MDSISVTHCLKELTHPLRLSFLLVLVTISWTSVAQNFTGNKDVIREIDEEVRKLMDEGDIPGLSLIILQSGKTIIKNYGYTNLVTKNCVTDSTLFQLASCSKAFTALALRQLVEEEKIDLDANVSKYISWFKVRHKNENYEVTVRQLLHHTSGIPWNTISLISPGNDQDALERLVRKLINQELNDPPGKSFEYATINYDVLALIVQNVTHMPFEKYMDEYVFNKLGLHATSIGNPTDSMLLADGYKIGFFTPLKYDAPVYRSNNAAGYIFSNAIDLSRWMKLQIGLGNGSIAKLISLTHQRDESVPLHGMNSYAMGWDVKLDGTGEIEHAGLNPNYTSHISLRIKQGLAVGVLANSNSSNTSFIASKLMKLLAGDRIEREYNPGDSNDKVFTCVTILISIYLIAVGGFIIIMIRELSRKERAFAVLTTKEYSKFVLSVLFVLPFLIGIFLLPRTIGSFDWDSFLVWAPESFKVMAILVFASLLISYVAYFLTLLLPYQRTRLYIAPVTLVVSILAGLANVAAIILITGAVEQEKAIGYRLFYYVLAVVLYLLGRRFVQINMIKFTRGLIYNLRIQLIERIFSTSFEKFEKIDRGRIYTSLNDDVATIGDSSNLFVMLITYGITAIGAFIFMGLIAFWAAAITILLIVVIAVIYYFVGRSTQVYFEKARDASNIFMHLINSMIDGFKELSLKNGKKNEFKNDVAKSALESKDKMTTADVRYVNAFLVGESLLVSLLGAVAFGIPRLFPNMMLSTIMSFVIILLYLIGPINGILNAVPGVIRLKIAWNRIQQFLSEIPANHSVEEIKVRSVTKVNSIKASGLTFKYKEDANSAFEVGPIDLEVKAGQILFIVGGNGSGKSTFAKLLTGLYTPDNGHILIDGKVVKGQEVSEYFSAVFSPTYVFQKIYNVDWQKKASYVDGYLKMLDLNKVLSISGGKYSSINLSGGQRKRLSLLQCFLEDSPIYLFDEWAADQDPEYRKIFYRTVLPELKKQGKIIIAITHDDHYFETADIIIKMNEGKCEGVPKHIEINSINGSVVSSVLGI